MKTKKYSLILILGLLIFNNSYSQIRLRIPDTTAMKGSIIDIPVYADSSLTGKNVLSFQIQINYASWYSTYFTPISIINTGTLSQSFGSLTANLSIPGQITVAGAGTTPLSGIGKLFIIRIQTIQSYPSFYFSNGNASQSFFNEGSPSISWVSGYLNILAPPSVTIQQNSGTLLRGETMQFTATGGTIPYQWSVTNSSVASIISSGLLTANNVGFTKVRVQSFDNLIDTTDADIEVKGMRLRIPDSTAWQGSYINIPIYTTSLTNLGIMSGSLSIAYNQSILTPIDIITTNSMLQNFTSNYNFNIPGNINFSFAGTDTLTGTGKLMFIRFKVSSTTTGSSSLVLSNILFNQNLTALSQNGTFTTINFATLSISPGGGELVAGETMQFTTSGGITPYTWSTTDTNIATINSSGLLKAKWSGYVKVNVIDSVGASTQTSGSVKVYDTYVSIPNNYEPINAICYLPVNISNLPIGQSVSAIQGTITFMTPDLQFLDISTSGTLTNGWTFSYNLSGNQLTFAGAGTTPFSSMGTMFNLKFQTTSNLTIGEYAWVNINNITLDQGVPLPKIQNGNIIGWTTIPSVAGTITGNTSVCQGQAGVVYSVPAISGASYYIWTLPSGASGSSTTNSITVNFSNNAITDSIKVRGHNSFGDGPYSALKINVSSIPSAAGIITGLSSVCQGQNNIVYKVPKITNANSYIWTLPTGATGTSLVDSIIVNFGLSAVSGNITVKGSNVCEGAISSKTIIVNPIPTLGFTAFPAFDICNGTSVTLNGLGANSYSWSGGINNGIAFTPSTTTIYSLTGIGANGCSATVDARITVGGNFTLSTSSTNTSCSQNNGTATVIASGGNIGVGSGQLSYTPSSNISSFFDIYNLSKINDGGINDGTIFVTSNPYELTMTFASAIRLDSVKIKGGQFNADANIPGSMLLYRGTSATGNLLTTINPTYNYQNYSFTNNQKSQIYTWVITPLVQTGHSSIREITCYGTSEVYTYQWSANAGNQNTATATALGAGTYSVIVTDANGCYKSTSKTIIGDSISVGGSIAGSTTVCNSINNVTLTLSGNTGNIIKWQSSIDNWTTFNDIVNVSNTYTAINLTTTTQFRAIVQNGNCNPVNSAIATITISPIPVAAGTITGTTTVCQGQNNVTYSVPAINYATTYVWTWPTGATGTITANSLTVNYGTSAVSGNITVKGNNSCGDGTTTVLPISVNNAPTAPIVGTITQPTCTVATGSIVLNGLPSTGTWTINPGSISGSGTTTTISNLVAGTYNFTVTNASACTSVASANVVVNAAPSVPTAPTLGTITQPTCSVTTGSVILNGLPATGTWTINPGSISGTGTNKTLTGLAIGTYNYTVTNSSSCTSPSSANIVINTAPSAPTAPIVGTITQPSCTVATGSVVLNGLPSTGTWTINPGNISGSGTTTTITNLVAGTYNYTVTNASACTSVASANVVVNAQPTTPTTPTVGTITQPTCTAATGSVVLNGLPATGTWTINPGSISGTGTSKTITGLAVGTYNYTVTNASNCTSLSSANVVINAVPSAPAAPIVGTITQPTCTVATGSVVLNGLPSTGTWTINPGNISGSGTTTTISNLVAGTYNYTVTNASNCTSVASANVVINAAPSIPTAPTLGTITQPTCTVATGSVVLNGLPATGTWTINPGSISGTGTSKTLTGLAVGTYNYTVTNASNCTSPSSANIVINTAPSAPAAPIVGTITQPTCTVATGSVVLNGLPSTGTWTINPGNISGSGTTTTISNLVAGTYNYTVTNASNCTSVASANVVINTAPSAPAAPTVSVTQPTCTNSNGTVAITSSTIGLTFSTDGTNYTAYTSAYTITANAAYSITAKLSSSVCISTATTGTMGAQPAIPVAPTVSVTQPTCTNSNGSVAITSSITGLTFSKDGTNYATYTSAYIFAAYAAYSITAKNTSSGCISNATTGTMGAQPPTPAAAGTITGTTTVCQGQNNVVYSVPTIANATSYVWTWPTGATGIISTNSLTVNYGTSAVSGNITVKGNNSCGDGAVSTLAITVNPIPIVSNQTASISSGSTFTITPTGVSTGTLYTWTNPIYTGGVTGGSAQTTGQTSISQTLTIPSGTGTATYTVTPTSGACFGSSFTVTVTVTQAISCTLSVSPSNQNVLPSVGSTSFNVSAPITCNWTAVSNQTWCTLTSASGNGNGVITATYTQNTTGVLRIATVTTTISGVAPFVTTVTQAASCPPTWVPAQNQQYNMNVIAKLYLSNILTTNHADAIGAFVGTECRGIAYPNTTLDSILFLTISSNVQSGETITFKAWESATCSECPIAETISFVNQSDIGTISIPFLFHCGLVELCNTFGAGYTWFSVNVNPGSMTLNSLFSNITPCENDRIIGQQAFATFYGTQWIGSLNTIDPTAMYKMKLCTQQTWCKFGLPVPIVPITISSGYPWIGYLPQSNLPINTALNSITPAPVSNDRFNAQYSFATYSGTTWIGSLTTLQKGKGYIIHLTNPSVLTYSSSSNKSAVNINNTLITDALPIKSNVKTNARYNMQIIATIILPDGTTSLNALDTVYAFVGNECRGISSPAQGLNGKLFLTVGSDISSGEVVTFKVYLNGVKSYIYCK